MSIKIREGSFFCAINNTNS